MIKKSLYTKSLGRLVARQALLSIGMYHVITRGNSWSVVKAGNRRSSRVFAKKGDAILYAKKYAKKNSTAIIVHTKTGDVESRLSFAS